MSTPNLLATTEDFEFAALQEATNYPQAISQEFAPYLKGKNKTIEVGAGIGQMTKLFLEKNKNLICIEPELRFITQFKKNHPSIPLWEGTIETLPEDHKKDCGSIVSVNVIEHIEHDVEEIERYYNILKPHKGYLCILTPAREELYSPLDKDFGHFRRYTKKNMKEALLKTGFKIEKLHYFNFTGYFAWLLNFKILKSKSFNPTMVRIYDRTIFRLTNSLETKILRPPVGQSIVAIAQAA